MRILFLLLIAVAATFGQSTIHILSPWASDPALVTNRHHVLGGFSDYAATEKSQMTDEGNGWFSYTLPAVRDSWWDLTLKNCPVASDQNCTGGLTLDWKPKIDDLIGSESEVWIYPDASTLGYHVELIPPYAKIVWFKSPWGNKSLPEMIVGTDTIRMHYATSPDRCGWFYAALRDAQITLGAVHFRRAFTSITLPTTGTVDLSAGILAGDSIFVDGTQSPLAPSNVAGSAGACFDSSKVVHILHPWPLDPSRGIRPVYLRAGNLLGNYKVMRQDDTLYSNPGLKGWYSYSFPGTTNWSQNEVLEFMSFFPTPENSRLTFNDRPAGKTIFPNGVYEVWLLPIQDSLRIINAPVSPRYVQLRNPWSNTVPRLVISGDTLLMASLPDTCGWYRATVWQEPADWKILFKQAIGFDFYSMDGLKIGLEIDIDSVMSLGNTAWLIPNPFPTGAPRVATKYQGPPGDCPNRELAVMVFDWANTDRDFGNTYDGSDAADDNVKCPGLVRGIVEPILGPTGVPIKSATSPVECTALNNLSNWFLPQLITGTYTNATCYDLPLHMDDEGFWLADIAADSARQIQGFFPLDSFNFLDPAQTIPNPKYGVDGLGSDVDGVRMSNHNYYFTMHINATFVYVPGQYFEFRGDDDVWVFINNKLVVDLGGVHGPEPGSVDLDTLGLTPGTTYPFHIFFAERNCCGSNFKMRTSMDLKTDRAYYPVRIDGASNVIRFDIYQILREQSLSCDFSAQASVDTVLAPSTFALSGPQFPEGPVALTSGINYGGININANYTGFTIDTSAIIAIRALAPGQYTLTFTNSVDATLSSFVNFTVPEYPLPAILFTDAAGNPINPDTVALGEWAFVAYPVHVQARYVGIPCATCTDLLQLTTSDSLIFLDSLKNQITSIALLNGRATFWVMGLKSLDSASFKVAGASVQNELIWKNITLKEPPVPTPRFARMFDRNGDGVCDSLIFNFTRSLQGKDSPDSLLWKWGDSTAHRMTAEEITTHIRKDSTIVITADSLYPGIFTGSTDGKPYLGSSTTWFTYLDKGVQVPFAVNPPIEDHAGAVVTKGIIIPGETFDTLEVTISESLAPSQKIPSMFSLAIWRNGLDESTSYELSASQRSRSGSKYILLFRNSSRVVPTVGDSVRLVPGFAKDQAGITPHIDNPWVRIIGRQRSRLDELNEVVVLNPSTAPSKDSPVIIPALVNPGQTIEEIVEQEGMPGHLIRFDFANTIESSQIPLTPSQVTLNYEAWYYSNLGAFVNHTKSMLSCTDKIFNGDCTKNNGDVFLGWNMRSKDGRLVGTGVYLVHFKYSIKAIDQVLEKDDNRQVWGIRREK